MRGSLGAHRIEEMRLFFCSSAASVSMIVLNAGGSPKIITSSYCPLLKLVSQHSFLSGRSVIKVRVCVN
jgi:hypothetical protein